MQKHFLWHSKVTRCYSYRSSLWDIEKAADKPCCLYPSLVDWVTEVSQTSCHAWEMEVQVAQTGSCGKYDKSDPILGRCLQGWHKSGLLICFLESGLLCLLYLQCMEVFLGQWQEVTFCTLKDCSLDVRHGADSALDKKHTSSEAAGGKVGGKCNSHCCDQKSSY